MKLSAFVFLILACCIFSCNTETVHFKILSGQQYQAIHGFGASDAWSNQLILKMSKEHKAQVATWLFSNDRKEDGSPEGIGLSVWRFNIGAGSAEQGEQSGIGNAMRREECFLSADGNYNWNKQAGQQWMLHKANDMGVSTFIGFVNSPPVHLTKNGKAFSAVCDSSNLAEENYLPFSNALVDIMEHFQENDIVFDYISPVNEPQWGWCERDGQEGCPWSNDQLANLVKVLNTRLEFSKLPTRIHITESGILHQWLVDTTFVSDRDNQAYEFFHPESHNYVGNLSRLAPHMVGHSYFTTWPDTVMTLVRDGVTSACAAYGLEYWMSEYCMLENNPLIKGNGRDLGMDAALYLARLMHHDLVTGNASSWQWWLGLSCWDFKDGLVYTGKEAKEIYDSKLLWTMGNYSAFVRPGARRIGIQTEQPVSNDLLVSAYTNIEEDGIVVVATNLGDVPQSIQLTLEKGVGDNWEVFETSESKNLEHTGVIPGHDKISVPEKSILTLISKGS